MIDLYTWSTPNGRKAAIMLEELALPYQVHPVDISKDEQFAPEFVKISPNSKIPAIVDHDVEGGPLAVFESAAILIHLAETTGSPLLPSAPPARSRVMAWTMFQMSMLGPMLGQLGHFTVFAKETVPYAIERYTRESRRAFQVLEGRLAESVYLADDYSIADIISYPWVAGYYGYLAEKAPSVGENTPNIARWLKRIGSRDAVQRGMQIP